MRIAFVEVNDDKVRSGNEHGVGVFGHRPQQAEFIAFQGWTPVAGDTVLLCTKCYHNRPVLERLNPDVDVIPIQNGFDPDLESRGHEWEAIASFVSECAKDRPYTHITRQGSLHLGLRGNGASTTAPGVVANLLRARLFRAKIVPHILPFKYTKLMYNAAISPLAAAAGLDNGQLLSVPLARRLFFALLQENYQILRRARIPLGKIGPFHPVTVNRILQRRFLANVLAWAFYPSLRGSYCSMSGDLPAGRTEIGYYNRHLVQLAAGEDCALNQRVCDLIERMETGQPRPGLAALLELV
jgi:2-dehydropantoate 2-reductase